MKAIPAEVRARRRTVIDAAIVFIVIVLLTQMWLLTATLETYLAGHHSAALPGMIASGVLWLVCLALYRMMRRIDRAAEVEEEPHGM